MQRTQRRSGENFSTFALQYRREELGEARLQWREDLVDIKVVKVYKPTEVDLVGAAGHVEGATEAADVK